MRDSSITPDLKTVTDAERQQALDWVDNEIRIQERMLKNASNPANDPSGEYALEIPYIKKRLERYYTIRRALSAPVVQVTDLEALKQQLTQSFWGEDNDTEVCRAIRYTIDHIVSEYDLVKKVK